MSVYKEQAIEVINHLHEENRLDNSDYCIIHDGLSEIECLRDRDEVLEELWEQFGDVPMNPETECIEEPFMGWGAGIHREEIWHWFDERHSKGVAYLMYGRILRARPIAATWNDSQAQPAKFKEGMEHGKEFGPAEEDAEWLSKAGNRWALPPGVRWTNSAGNDGKHTGLLQRCRRPA